MPPPLADSPNQSCRCKVNFGELRQTYYCIVFSDMALKKKENPPVFWHKHIFQIFHFFNDFLDFSERVYFPFVLKVKHISKFNF